MIDVLQFTFIIVSLIVALILALGACSYLIEWIINKLTNKNKQ